MKVEILHSGINKNVELLFLVPRQKKKDKKYLTKYGIDIKNIYIWSCYARQKNEAYKLV